MTAFQQFRFSIRTFASDIAQGFLAISHNGLALIGLIVFSSCIALSTQPELRAQSETLLLGWLQQQLGDEASVYTDADAVDRATAADPSELPKQQANLAYWLSKKYHVAAEPLSAIVAEAYDVGPKNDLDPTLILAVMGIESGFNPFAQSTVGAQGLMQVMTKVHSEKYNGFGGTLAAFDPVANLRVGVNVLKDCIARAGSIDAGLRLYVGAEHTADGRAYATKVLTERSLLAQVAKGGKVPTDSASTINAAADSLGNMWDKAQKLASFGNIEEN